MVFHLSGGRPDGADRRSGERGGDAGETFARRWRARLPKDALRIVAIGAVDEANAAIGVLRLATQAIATEDAMLARIQNDLFDVGADLSVPGKKKNRQRLTDAPVLGASKQEVAALYTALPKLDQLRAAEAAPPPAQRPVQYGAHHRPTAAERGGGAADRQRRPITPALLRYLNRLSDHLFVLARVLNGNGANDVLWSPGRTSRDRRLPTPLDGVEAAQRVGALSIRLAWDKADQA